MAYPATDCCVNLYTVMSNQNRTLQRKVPAPTLTKSAIAQEALALIELKQNALAQARLQYLVEHFPQSEEAPLAKERLASLKE